MDTHLTHSLAHGHEILAADAYPDRRLTGGERRIQLGHRVRGPLAVILSRDQLPVPSKLRVRGHEGLSLEEPSSANLPGVRGEPPTLLIGEPKSLSAELVHEAQQGSNPIAEYKNSVDRPSGTPLSVR
jgi:hypothetical protein